MQIPITSNLNINVTYTEGAAHITNDADLVIAIGTVTISETN